MMLSANEQLELVWQQRADRLARRRDSAARPRAVLQAIIFEIGRDIAGEIAGEQYGLALECVRAILPPVACTPVPGMPRALAGVIEVHGEVRPVLDLRRMLGLAAGPSAERKPVVLLHHRGRQFGLQADRVEQLRTIPKAELQTPGGDAAPGLATRYLEYLTPVMLLSADALAAELFKETA